MVRADLSPVHFGIAWWKAPTESKDELRRRIVVADYLVAAVEAVEHNLLDLMLHYLEVQDFWDQEGAFLRSALRTGPGGNLIPAMPPREKPIDEFPPAMVDLHVGGIFRSLGSALDCLASARWLTCASDLAGMPGERLISRSWHPPGTTISG
jgi:hypothetical protein